MTVLDGSHEHVDSAATLLMRHTCGVQPPLPVADGRGPFTFVQPDSYDSVEIEVQLSAAGDELASRARFNISVDLSQRLSELAEPRQVGADDRDALITLTRKLAAAQRRLLHFILQELRIEARHTLTYRSGSHWSIDGESWKAVPSTGLMAGVNVRPLFKVDEEWHIHIQSLLHSHEEPLLATHHLREAQRNDGPFAWIQATVAAELAIKEALLRLERRLEPLLLEVPSPPLRKLYGPLLEEYGGEKSPYVKELHRGAEVRNRLVHRPQEHSLVAQDVVDYVNVVEKSLRHLSRLCRKRSATGRTEASSNVHGR